VSLDIPNEMQQATGCQQHQHAAINAVSESGSRHPYGPTAEEWDSLKDVIRQLYVYDQRPLKQVKEHLETNYNFHATYDQASPMQNPSSMATRLTQYPASECLRPDLALGV
jgi:Clr5 domain